ncbi:hypothetical protein Tco_0550447, partial [Tanacetum coccineum]
DDPIWTVQLWTREEETLLCECWVEVSENNGIRADRSDDSFWWQITDDFNKATHLGDRSEHMTMGKWARINGYFQKFNAIYKHLQRKSGENEVDHIDTTKINFSAVSNGKELLLEHAIKSLKGGMGDGKGKVGNVGRKWSYRGIHLGSSGKWGSFLCGGLWGCGMGEPSYSLLQNQGNGIE